MPRASAGEAVVGSSSLEAPLLFPQLTCARKVPVPQRLRTNASLPTSLFSPVRFLCLRAEMRCGTYV
eukprot:154234-Rhodomonas_salina.1